MSRDDVIRPYLAKYVSNFPLDKIPPLDNYFHKRLGHQLPRCYWQLALTSQSFINEYKCNRAILKLLMELFEAYGNCSLDWCQRKYAVMKKRCCDVKRIADFANIKEQLYRLLYDEWKLESYILMSACLQGHEPALIRSSVERVLGALSICFGPDSLIEILENNLNSIYSGLENSEFSDLRDYKTILQEETQRRFHKVPVYEIISESGPDHAKEFLCRVSVSDHQVTSIGVSKKKAEKAAAEALLIKIGSTVSSGNNMSNIGTCSFELKKHQIPSLQLDKLQKAEAFLKHSFRTLELLSSALIQKSFINEVKRPKLAMLLSYEALASVGSAAVRLIALDYCLENIHNLISDDVEKSMQIFKEGLPIKAGDLSITETARTLSPLLMVGKGQSGAITSQMKSEVVQAVLAAILLDCDDKKWRDKLVHSQVVVSDICHRIKFQNVSILSIVDPKTHLQEIAQSIRWGIEYQLADKGGADHEQRFKSLVIISIGSTNFKFFGSFAKSKRESEKRAASFAIKYLSALNPLSPDNDVLFVKSDSAKRFGSDVVKSIVELLKTGPVAWKQVKKLDLLGLSEVFKEDKSAVIYYLSRFHDSIQRLRLSDILTTFPDSISTAPVTRKSIIGCLEIQLGQWISTLTSTHPDNLDTANTSQLLKEIQLYLAALNYEARNNDSSQKAVADLVKVLKMAGHDVQCYKNCLNDLVAPEVIDLLVVVAGFISDEADCIQVFTIKQIEDSLIFTSDIRAVSQSKIELLSTVLRNVDIAVEVNFPVISIVTSNMNSANNIPWEKLVLRNLQRSLTADREQLKYAAQLLHDAKNMIIAAQISAQLSISDSSKRFTHYASIEQAIYQAKSLIVGAQCVIRSISDLIMTKFSFRAFLTNIVADIMRQMPAEIALSSYIDRAEIEFEGDENALRSAILNMVKNALSSAGSNGDIGIEAIYDSSSNVVIIEVSNSGDPIPEHVIKALKTNILPRSSTHEGYGLGIASINRVAKAHNGSFMLSNRNGRAIASLELPTAPNIPTIVQDNIQIDTEDLE